MNGVRALARTSVSNQWALCGACIDTVLGHNLLAPAAAVSLPPYARVDTTHVSQVLSLLKAAASEEQRPALHCVTTLTERLSYGLQRGRQQVMCK